MSLSTMTPSVTAVTAGFAYTQPNRGDQDIAAEYVSESTPQNQTSVRTSRQTIPENPPTAVMFDLETWRHSVDQQLAYILQWQLAAEVTTAKLKERVGNLDDSYDWNSMDGCGDMSNTRDSEQQRRKSSAWRQSALDAHMRLSSPAAVCEIKSDFDQGHYVTRDASIMDIGRSMALSTDSERVSDYVCLQHSVWDAALLIGMRLNPDGALHISGPTTLLVVMLLLLDLAVQAFCLQGFVFVVMKMREAEFSDDSLLGQQLQRFNFNQHIGQFDFMTMQTREHMTCQRMYPSLLSAFYDDIAAYLQHNPGDIGVPGRHIAFASMLLWSCSIMIVLRRLLDIFLAIYHLPDIRDVEVSIRNDVTLHNVVRSYSTYYVFFLGRMHKRALYLLLGFRTVLCSLLLWVGLAFLATTYEVEDLVLNACALEIIKTFQQTVLNAVVSPDLVKKLEHTRIRLFYSKSVPRWNAPETVYSTSVGSVRMRFRFIFCRLVFVLGILGLASALLLNPFVTRLELAEKTICGGDVNFVWTQHPTAQFPIVSNTVEHGRANCFDAAKLDFLLLRAKAPTRYLRHASLDGCAADDCHATSLSNIVHWWQDSNWDDTAQKYQYDVDSHTFGIIREVCLHPEFYEPSTSFFEEVRGCDDLLIRKGGSLKKTQKKFVIGNHTISESWRAILGRLCRSAELYKVENDPNLFESKR